MSSTEFTEDTLSIVSPGFSPLCMRWKTRLDLQSVGGKDMNFCFKKLSISYCSQLLTCSSKLMDISFSRSFIHLFHHTPYMQLWHGSYILVFLLFFPKDASEMTEQWSHKGFFFNYFFFLWILMDFKESWNFSLTVKKTCK